jgi:alpha-glucuronidase
MRQQPGKYSAEAGDSGYDAWLSYPALPQGDIYTQYVQWCGAVDAAEEHETVQAALHEWQ